MFYEGSITMLSASTIQTGHTYLFTVGGLSFYEHGKYGDDSSLLVTFNRVFYYSGYYDKPDTYEAEDLRNAMSGR